MADVVDTMFGWIVDIIGWLIDKTIKLIGWIIKMLFKGIVAVFRSIFHKDKPSEDVEAQNEPNSTVGEQPIMRAYEDLVDDINGITEINIEDYSEDKMMNIMMTVLLHNSLSYAQKARLLALSDKKIEGIVNNPVSRAHFYASLVDAAYALLNHMSNNALKEQWDKYKAALDSNNTDVELEPLGNYLISIMNTVAAMYSPDGKASFKIEMLEGIELPTWAGNLV